MKRLKTQKGRLQRRPTSYRRQIVWKLENGVPDSREKTKEAIKKNIMQARNTAHFQTP